MSLDNIYYEFSQKLDYDHYVELAEAEVLTVPVIIDMLISNRSAASTAQRLLEKISAKNPLLVYPYFEYIIQSTEKINSFTKWNNWKIITNLISCDYLNFWSKIKPDYIKALSSEQISEFCIACDCVPRVISEKPEIREEIFDILRSVETREFKIEGIVSEQCNSVAKEKVNELFEKLR